MSDKKIQIKNLVLGEGQPKICVPVVGTTCEEIRIQARAAAAAGPDLVEWRADCYEKVLEDGKAEEMMEELTEILQGVPVLFTFRSDKEGGSCRISPEEYRELNLSIARQRKADLVDVEAFMKDLNAAVLIEKIKKEGRIVVASSHHFHETPRVEKMMELYRDMAAMNADIVKLAVMPATPADVLKLLSATCKAKEELSQPVISMAMGSLGTVSRVCGETFGSCITFASVGAASAPGQLAIDEVKTIQNILHQA
ncbi:MAG: type I 3-dehydroquinate dehydratase [Lachnospiraceae bacterium]|nr:type I 3-dehydroquinate dehydratase [Lachnospiraceae bacterium]